MKTDPIKQMTELLERMDRDILENKKQLHSNLAQLLKVTCMIDERFKRIEERLDHMDLVAENDAYHEGEH